MVSFTHEQNIICSQTLLTALHMSRPLFVGSYSQVTWAAPHVTRANTGTPLAALARG